MVNYTETPFRAEMVLNLTRTVATQAVRGFTHQTWVSGRFKEKEKHKYCIYFLQGPLAPGSLLPKSALTVFSSLLVCLQVATLITYPASLASVL